MENAGTSVGNDRVMVEKPNRKVVGANRYQTAIAIFRDPARTDFILLSVRQRF